MAKAVPSTSRFSNCAVPSFFSLKKIGCHARFSLRRQARRCSSHVHSSSFSAALSRHVAARLHIAHMARFSRSHEVHDTLGT